MEPENRAVCEVIASEFLTRRFSLTVDCHSGFGVNDRIWFPYAHTRMPIAHLAEMHALNDLLQETLCNHRYIFEPQSSQYLAHGDLWDHLYLQARARPDQVFLPMTLELGSWAWVKKNPRQIFSPPGHLQPPDRTPPAAGVAGTSAPPGIHGPCRGQHRRWLPWPGPRGPSRTRHDPLVSRPADGWAVMSTWILLRGLTREKRPLGPFPQQLLAEFPDARILALELPGNGELNAMASPMSIAGMASFCREELARHGRRPALHPAGDVHGRHGGRRLGRKAPRGHRRLRPDQHQLRFLQPDGGSIAFERTNGRLTVFYHPANLERSGIHLPESFLRGAVKS
jgi:hypothetical protein